MVQITNPSVATLTQKLLQLMRENGYAESNLDVTIRFAKKLSNFMDEHSFSVYDESIGNMFIEEKCQLYSANRHYVVKLFIARLNSVFQGRGLINFRQRGCSKDLPSKLEQLIVFYKAKCKMDGCAMVTIARYELCCRQFLGYLAEDKILDYKEITTEAIAKACLRISTETYFPVLQRFLNLLFTNGYLEKDYSYIVPKWKRPHPMPSAYSMQEVAKIEATINRDTPFGKRNYAMLLLATRLAMRAGDIVRIVFDDLDFKLKVIRIKQHKTGVLLELPMLPAVQEALQDYIENARMDSASSYVFLSFHPPYSHISATAFGQVVRSAIKSANIDIGFRKSGSHTMRSSLATSMVNDGVPYEVVRRSLGHTSANAIRNYAKLDVKQLSLYALKPPAVTGNFAEILAGRCSTK